MFAGIGGFDLAARWMGWETAWYTEIDPFCCATMAHHFPEARSLGDVTAVDWGQVEPVDLMCGGFPCQDISVAGKRKGIHGERSGLWKEYARAIRDLRPRWVVGENVGRLLRAGYDVVRGDLRAAGYRVARPVLLSASALGAPHELAETGEGFTLLIEGGAAGADRLAREWAESLGILVETVPAEWDKWGKAAGAIRNRVMLQKAPDLVIAFAGCRGTADMMRQARAAGVPVIEIQDAAEPGASSPPTGATP